MPQGFGFPPPRSIQDHLDFMPKIQEASCIRKSINRCYGTPFGISDRKLHSQGKVQDACHFPVGKGKDKEKRNLAVEDFPGYMAVVLA